MNKYFKRLYITIFLLVLSLVIGLLLQYNYYNNSINKEIKANATIRLDHSISQLNNHMTKQVQIIESVESFMRTTQNDHTLSKFLEYQLHKTQTMESLYYAKPNGQFIDGNGWTPSKTYDLFKQPWYQQASKSTVMITTPVYRHPGTHQFVISFAKPIYNTNNKLIGIIGSDYPVKTITTLLADFMDTENSKIFFLDENHHIVVHSQYDRKNNAPLNLGTLFPDIVPYLDDDTKTSGIHITTYEGTEGYFAWQTLDNTNWIIGSFTPHNDLKAIRANFQKSLILMFTVLILLLVLVLLLQRKNIVNPLIELNDDLSNIYISDQISYRLPIAENDPFFEIRKTTNDILSRTQGYFENLESSNHALKISQDKNTAIISVLPDMIFIYDHKGIFRDYLTNTTDQLIMSKSDFLGKDIFDVLPKDVAESTKDALEETFRTGKMQQFSYSIETEQGYQHYEARMTKVNDNEIMAIVRNITEQLVNLEQIEDLSYKDQLTGLYNRHFFQEELLRLDVPRNLPLSIAIFDINGLRLTNDAYGHTIGDELLKIVAEVIKDQCRLDEIISRIGGDEFAILLPSTTEEQGELIINRIKTVLSDKSIENIPISVSAGCHTKHNADEEIMSIFVAAENDMYKHKASESQSLHNKIIQTILYSLNHKSATEKFHSERVSLYSKQIGRAMNLRYDQMKELETASLVHDIGKVGIRDTILNKSSELTPEEYDEVKRHSEIGYQLLSLVDMYKPIASYVLYQHERWDGKGYPQQLVGTRIPLISRIIAVADAYEAMTASRPFRKQLSEEDAQEELRRHADTQFDPHVVAAFLEVLKKHTK